MRIVAGTAGGRALRAPRGLGTRPTSDKVRAAVFNLLGQFFEGGRVLDLYAGSGAMAIEALSRGCGSAVCVESGAVAAAAIRHNAQACGFADRVEVRHERVEQAFQRLSSATFDLVFVDPPYDVGPERDLSCLGPLVAQGGMVVAEHDRRRPPAERYGALTLADRRSYGGTGVSIYRLE